MFRKALLCIPVLAGCFAFVGIAPAAPLRLAVFDCDVTPPPGSLLAYDRMERAGELGLRARGLAVLDAGLPIVLCAVDWIGIANEGYAEFRQTLATAAGTSPERVALHALHQHDAPICDFSTARILQQHGLDPGPFDPAITRPLMQRTATALQESLAKATPVTHAGWGQAKVPEVASNRRVLSPTGIFLGQRFTACKDPQLRAAPEGVIDPLVRVIGLWNGEQPLAVLSYFATHPQSYYRTGIANPDFPGIARFLRSQAVPGALHIHFAGAGGDIGAGKYNDGAPANRVVLANRLATAMAEAWQSVKREPLTADQVGWTHDIVTLPPSPSLDEQALGLALLGQQNRTGILGTAMQLAWLQSPRQSTLSCLRLGTIRILHLPGELFVEYQIAAAAHRPDLQVAMAAYGEYGPGYIPTARAFSEGGYEVQASSSFTAPEAEDLLTKAIRKLLGDPPQ